MFTFLIVQLELSLCSKEKSQIKQTSTQTALKTGEKMIQSTSKKSIQPAALDSGIIGSQHQMCIEKISF